MTACLGEDDLLDLVEARVALADAPIAEAHLADCGACAALLQVLLATQAEAAAPATPRRQLGPYRLDTLIGSGAMGEVYRAWDARLARHVAVKVLSRAGAEDPERSRRLEAEGRAAAAISHPNVVTVYDTGTDAGVPYVVSELIVGESLRSRLDRGALPRAEALALGVQLARGLAAAHAQGVVHRDLKPANLVVTADGTLKILDFGLAKVAGEREVSATEPGTLMGTAGYLAPEQARGEPAQVTSDVFSVGAILYELLAGRRAFVGATFAERITAVLRDTPPALADAAWPIVARCLAKDPRQRFQAAADLAWALERVDQAAVASAAEASAVVPPATAGAHRPSRRHLLAGAAAAGVGGALLGRWSRRPVVTPAAVVHRQVTFRQGRVASARFTADGDSLLYAAAWDGEPTAISSARLGGGGTRALDLPPAQLLAVSARGELAVSLDHHFTEAFGEEGELAVAPLEGGAPRRLGVMVQAADFAPDGELAIVRWVDGRCRLESPPGRVLLEEAWISHPRVAPDGRLIACLVHDDASDDRGAAVVVPRAGGAVRVVRDDWSSVDGLAWAPSGRTLWLSGSHRGGNNTVRELDLDGHQHAALPSVGRLRIHDVSATGTLAVTLVTARLRMMVKAPGADAEVDLSLSDVSMAADISADGTTIAFAEFGDAATAYGAYLRTSTGGPALRLGDGYPLDLDDAGRGVLTLSYAVEPTVTVLPVDAGAARPLALPGFTAIRSARWCGAGQLVVIAARAGGAPRVWRVDPRGGATPLTAEGVAGVMRVSPDQRTLALIHGGRLWRVPVDGATAPAPVPGAFADQDVCGWAADGTAVLTRGRAAVAQLRRVELATGDATLVATVAPPALGRRGVHQLVVADDAVAYAYSYGQELSRLFTAAVGDSRT